MASRGTTPPTTAAPSIGDPSCEASPRNTVEAATRSGTSPGAIPAWRASTPRAWLTRSESAADSDTSAPSGRHPAPADHGWIVKYGPAAEACPSAAAVLARADGLVIVLQCRSLPGPYRGRER